VLKPQTRKWLITVSMLVSLPEQIGILLWHMGHLAEPFVMQYRTNIVRAHLSLPMFGTSSLSGAVKYGRAYWVPIPHPPHFRR
jgi:hypothetical protein